MNQQIRSTQMDQRIFELGLPVETVSVYLLCTGISDTDQALTLETLRSVWNGDEATLRHELDVLRGKGILSLSDDEPGRYRVHPASEWR